MATLAKQAQQLNCTARYRTTRRGTPLPPLVMITDAKRVTDPIVAVQQLPRGSMVILRDYDHPDRRQLAHELAKTCRHHGVVFLVAGLGTLAAEVRADGIHLPERLAPQTMRWRLRRKTWLITVAAHSLPAIRRARHFGADAVLVSPVFPTQSHPGAATLGALRFTRLVHGAGLPVYGLGGISAMTARRLGPSGAVGLAAIDAFGVRS